jgi:hypothetical protein
MAPPVAAPPTTTLLSPARVAGTYRLMAAIERGSGRAGQRPQAGPATVLILQPAPVAAPDASIHSATQFGASVNLRGYTRAPRGRSGQAAAWYPVPGDSIVIQFASQVQRGAQVQLRGAFSGRRLSGDIWFVTAEGTTFQLGTFSANR